MSREHACYQFYKNAPGYDDDYANDDNHKDDEYNQKGTVTVS